MTTAIILTLVALLLVGFIRYIAAKKRAQRERIAALYGWAPTFKAPRTLEQGSFKKVLKEKRKPFPFRNQRGKKIGTVTALSEARAGLQVEGKITDRKMKKVLKQAGQMSIGCVPIRTEELEKEDDGT
jgi:hypothetical protein